MTDLVTRLRALADLHYPAKLTVVLREAADALEETAAYKGGNSLAEAWKERDALKAKLVEAEKANSAMDMIKATMESGKLLDEVTLARRERDEARAEAADFRELLKEMRDLADKDGYLSRILSVKVIDQALSQPGPGAALLERVKKLQAAAEAAQSALEECEGTHAYDPLKLALGALEEKP